MKVFAHRGFSGCYPENTMLAFKEASKTGCFGIELDVQITKDGEIVVFHDETIDRVTDGSGFLRDYTCEELSRFNAANLWKGKFEFQKIPTFREYCEWVKDTSLVTNVELKTGVFYYEELEEKTIEMVREYGLSDRIIFSSFNHLSIERTKKLAPEIPVGALVEHEGLGNAGYYCSKYGYQYYHPGFKGLTSEEVAGCHSRGVGINVWTINDMEALKQMEEWKVNSVISNFPDVCLAYLNRQNQG